MPISHAEWEVAASQLEGLHVKTEQLFRMSSGLCACWNLRLRKDSANQEKQDVPRCFQKLMTPLSPSVR